MTPRSIVVLMIVALEGAAFAAPSAEELFEQGHTAFANGDYASAVATWTESFRLSNEPELLFNIAQALENQGRCVEALATYRRFIALAPGSEQRPLAEEFVRELTAKCDVAKEPPHEEQPIEKHPRTGAVPIMEDKGTPPAGLKIAGLAVAGAGIVSVATGLYFGHRASALDEEVRGACPGPDCNWAVLGSKDAEGRSAETKHYVFVGIGAAALIGGGVMYWWASRQERSASIAIAPGSDGAAVTWSGSW